MFKTMEDSKALVLYIYIRVLGFKNAYRLERVSRIKDWGKKSKFKK